MASHMKPCDTVDVKWMLDHLDDPQVRLVEVDWDIETYVRGHAPGAIGWIWSSNNHKRASGGRVPDKLGFGTLMSQSGIANQMTVALYGERNNLWACIAARLLMAYGHADVRIVEGGGKKWLIDHKLVSTKKPLLSAKHYDVNEPDWAVAPQQLWYTTLCQLGPPDVTPSLRHTMSKPARTLEHSDTMQGREGHVDMKRPRSPHDWGKPKDYEGALGLTLAVCFGLLATSLAGAVYEMINR
jgi:rhodanese-like protein